jgi:hypothetical protein
MSLDLGFRRIGPVFIPGGSCWHLAAPLKFQAICGNLRVPGVLGYGDANDGIYIARLRIVT